MLALTILIGGILGLALDLSPRGLVIGLVLGYLFGELSRLKRKLGVLEDDSLPRAQTLSAPEQPAPPVREVHEPYRDEHRGAAVVAPVNSVSLPEPRPIAAADVHVAAPPADVLFIDQWIARIKDFLTGGNTVVRVGVIVLFFGVAFLLKYAAEHAYLPIELRLVGTGVGAIVLLALGWKLRKTNEAYGLTLEGGAIGVLYLTIFAAFRLYALMPASLAFALLVAVCAFSAMFAVLQNSLALAVLGVSGGFLAPVLASTGAGSHVMLFSYFAVLNAGIVAIAWYKAWRLLNLVGFGFTFVIGALWGYRSYQPEHFATTEPFLILFFLFYVAVAVLFAWRQPPALKRPVDGSLVFGVPLVGFALQATLVSDYPYGLAWSALALGTFYLALASAVLKRAPASMKMLAEAFLALGIIFASLTIPLAVDGRWTAAAWAVEGAGILWIGLRQRHLLACVFGVLLQIGGGFMFLTEQIPVAGWPFLNQAFVGTLLIALAGWWSAYLLHRHRSELHPWQAAAGTVGTLLLIWGSVWWYVGGVVEIHHQFVWRYIVTGALAFAAATAIAHDALGKHLAWPALRYVALLLLPFMVLALPASMLVGSHPFAGAGFVAWALALLGQYWILRRHETEAPHTSIAMRHAAGLWVLAILLSWEAAWAVEQTIMGRDWTIAAIGLTLGLLFVAATSIATQVWPLRTQRELYLTFAAAPLATALVVWLMFGNVAQSGDTQPLTYVPLLNPLDAVAVFVLLALFSWMLRVRTKFMVSAETLFSILGAATFIWLNAVLFRSLHHWGGIPYYLDAMLGSVLVQAAISLFWTIVALALMVSATRVRSRRLWIVGAGLLGVVVLKLFVVDLSNTATVARIVSFLGVGALLLVVGFFSPVPPKTKLTEA